MRSWLVPLAWSLAVGLAPTGGALPVAKAEAPSAGAQGSSAGPRSRRRAPRWEGRYRIRPGDTLSSIARRYRVTVTALRRANRLRGDGIREGRTLRIPGRGAGRQRRQGARPQNLTEAQQQALAFGRALGLDHRTGNQLLIHPPQPRWVEAAGDPASLDGTLQVPVDQGRFLRGWGSGAGGYHLALDLGERQGTAVLAAEAGLVLYAGNGIRGYGNIVILVHPNGWTTWYAHNHQNRVVPGQRVDRGEVIGTVGQTGYAKGPHLHFVLADGLEHCDPLPLMEGRLTDRSGAPFPIEAIPWRGERPEEIRCATRASRPHPRYRHRGRRRRR